MGKQTEERKKRPLRRFSIISAAVVLAVFGLFLLYTSSYAHAEQSALDALRSDKTVSVEQTEYGYCFDGPSTDSALIFYPGGRVDEKAYAPLLHQIAARGMDVCLVKMPFHLAVFGLHRADAVMARHSYENWYIGGHSLGGAMAADYAAENAQSLRGLILLAAYPTKPLSDELSMLSVYGSEDCVLRRASYEAGMCFWPVDAREEVIEGGNHAQFGNYGAQSGDGMATISAETQQEETVEEILAFLDGMAAQSAA